MGAILARRIREQGPLPFPEFMEAALYHPELGYYARGGPIGRTGDFFTSVSVGPLFGEFLASRFLRHFAGCGRPPRWRIIECGAHHGQLAGDVLRAIRRLDPEAFERVEYAIPEPLAALRAIQGQTLAGFGETVRLIESAADLADEPLPGIAFGNEVLDALPFHVIERRGGEWRECLVALGSQGGFEWSAATPTDAALTALIGRLGDGFPEGYRTEVRTCFRQFLAPLARALVAPLMIWPDYGFARADYYQPHRTQGTLRTFRAHQAGDDPLADPGHFDITAHVDFTAVAEAAAELGGFPIEFRNQGAWLIDNARDWLRSQEGRPDPALARQFQTLVHPAHLGGAFQVLELSWQQGHETTDPALQHRLFAENPG